MGVECRESWCGKGVISNFAVGSAQSSVFINTRRKVLMLLKLSAGYVVIIHSGVGQSGDANTGGGLGCPHNFTL